jgi:hypothetical protein
LQLPHPLRFHGEIATEFRNLAFNVRQFNRAKPRVAS